MLSLILSFIFQPELPDLGLTVTAALPTYLRTLVTSDVDILIWEEVGYFSEYIFKEYHCLLFSYTKNILRNAPLLPYFIWSSCTSQLRVCCKSCLHMTRKVDFRDDLDALCSSIGNNLSDLVLSVPHSFTVWCSVISLAVVDMTNECLFSDRTYLSEFRIFLDLHSPSLVVSEVPVKSVELVYLHDIEIFLYLVDAEEMSCFVKVKTAICKTRSICDLYTWKFPFLSGSFSLSEDLDRKHLLDGLDSIVETFELRSLDYCSILAYRKCVCFCRDGFIKDEHETGFCRSFSYIASLSAHE